MKKYSQILKVAILSGCVFFASCDKVLDINPEDQIDAGVALTTKAGVSASIAAVYATMKGEVLYGNRLIGLGTALADDGMATNRSGRYNSEYRNLRGAHYSHWSTSYVALNRVNIILEGIPGISDPTITDAERAAWRGELLFLRALYHFNLVNAYAYIPGAIIESANKGGVPILMNAISTAEGALNAETPRVSQDVVYDAIYADLEEAISLLPSISNVGVANKEAAQLLLSRAALYRKDFPKAVQMADAVIASEGNRLLNADNYVAGFSAAVNPESLFEIVFDQPNESLGVNVSLQTLFTSLTERMPDARRDSSDVYTGRTADGSKADRGGFADLVPTVDLLNALGITVQNNGSINVLITNRTSDVRNMMFEVGASHRGVPYVECTKYIGKNGSINLDNTSVMRIAEAYLNRAEAYAEAGPQQNQALALQDVNKIRTNRGLDPVSGLTGQALIDEILLQRRLEFAFEGGHRFLDLKRRGMNINKPATNSTFNFDNVLLLPQIPVGDVDGSNNTIPQNNGY